MQIIHVLLEEQQLLHFKYFENESRIVYIHETGTPRHKHDFERLICILRDNNIKHNDIGLDVIMIEQN